MKIWILQWYDCDWHSWFDLFLEPPSIEQLINSVEKQTGFEQSENTRNDIRNASSDLKRGHSYSFRLYERELK